MSLPASGSLSESAPRISPSAIRGSHRDLCSGVPWSRSRVATIMWVLSTPESDIQPADSSSTMRAYVITSRPSPPCSGGMVQPKSPSSRMPATSSAG